MASDSKKTKVKSAKPGRLQGWLGIHPGEGRLVLRFWVLSLSLGFVAAAYFTSGTAVFVVVTEPKTLTSLLPLLYIASGLGTVCARWGFSTILKRVDFRSSTLLTLGLVLMLNLLFVAALSLIAGYLSLFLIGSALVVTITLVLCAVLKRLGFRLRALLPLGLFLVLSLLFSVPLTLFLGDLTLFLVEWSLLLIGSALFVSIAPVLGVLDLLFWGAVERLLTPSQSLRLSRLLTVSVAMAVMIGFLVIVLLIEVAGLLIEERVMSGRFLFAFSGIGLPIILLFVVSGIGLLAGLRSFWLLWGLSSKELLGSMGSRPTSNSVSAMSSSRPLRDKYILILSGLAIVMVLTHYLVDLGFISVLNAEYSGEGYGLTELVLNLAKLFFLIKLAEVVFLGFLAHWMSRYFAPGYGLQAFPLILLAGLSVFLILMPDGAWNTADWVWIILLSKGLEVVLRGPVFEPSFSVLFQPLTPAMETYAHRLLADRVRPIAILISGAILLFISLLPDWGSMTWFWTLVTVLTVFLGLSMLGQVFYRRQIVLALAPGELAEATAELWIHAPLPERNEEIALIQKVLPLYMADFPGEYHRTQEPKRRQAFAKLVNLPDCGPLRSIRAAAARRSFNELKDLASQYLLSRVQEISIVKNTSVSFFPSGPQGIEAAVYPSSLSLMLIRLGITRYGVHNAFAKIGMEHPRDYYKKLEKNVVIRPAELVEGNPLIKHDPANPFPGLRPFEPEEAGLFFGRKVHTRELLHKLFRNRFLAIVGTSGSGKSSLVRAGLIPALRQGKGPGKTSQWRVAIFRPGGDPIGELARALTNPLVLGSTGKQSTEEQRSLEATLAEVTLRRSAQGLLEMLRQTRLPTSEHLMVVVDQFEELFRFKRESEGRRGNEDAATFVKLLLEGSRAPDVRLYVVLTMRSDYLGDCAEFRDLPETINDAQYLIPQLTREQRREAIVAPVEVAGRRIEPRLVQRLLNDVGDNPDQLPILQHALMRTWDRWFYIGDLDAPLGMTHYEAIGRMASALSQHADEIYDGLSSDRQRQLAVRLFKALTDMREDGRGVRRATRLDRLAAGMEASLDEAIEAVDAFRQPGCSFLMPPAGIAVSAEMIVDISHESLMRIWLRLRQWVAEETVSAHTYHRLAETALLYEERKAGLWNDPDLSQAIEWREREKPNQVWAERYHPAFEFSMAFLDASDQAVREARRKVHIRVFGGVGITAALAILMFLLWVRAQTSLNQVAAFVHANQLEQLKGQCPLWFAYQPLRDEQLGVDAIGNCAKALQLMVPELVASLGDHSKTLTALEEVTKEDTKERSNFQNQIKQQTLVALVRDLENIEKSPLFQGDVDQVNMLNLLVASVQWSREIDGLKKDCALLFTSKEAPVTDIEAEAARCKQAVDDQGPLLKTIADHSIEGLTVRKFQSRNKKTPDIFRPDVDDLLEDLVWLPEYLKSDESYQMIERVIEAARSEAWTDAIAAIAANPDYHGLILKPRVGLVPLGPDPDSGLWEFAHVLSGETPQRGPDGRLQFTEESGVVLVLIPGGSFLMGSEQGDQNRRPVHEVKVSPFFIAKHELTQGQLFRLTGQRPSRFKGDDLLPAERVSFQDVSRILELSRLRLPTEAEWEYAGRAETTTLYWWGDKVREGDKVWANCKVCGRQWGGKSTAPVGSFPANPFGLYDTAGNIEEWVQDCLHYSYKDAPDDGSAWLDTNAANCARRVIRGGSWNELPRYLHSASRYGIEAGDRDSNLGFRLALGELD